MQGRAWILCLNLARRQFVFFDPRFQQGAPPGLWIPNPPPDSELHLRNLFPSHPERRIQLPGLWPRVRIHLSARDGRDARTRLATVLIQPDANRVVLVFAALCEVGRKYGPHEMAEMTWSIG